MKILLTVLCVSYVFCTTAFSQKMEGTYTNTWESTTGATLTYTLTLNPNKTFIFKSHRVFTKSHPDEKVVANGTWERKDRLLILNTDASEDDAELVKNLNSTKAQFKAYSPRHQNYGKVKPSLNFYKSSVFYAQGMKLEKKVTDAVTSNF